MINLPCLITLIMVPGLPLLLALPGLRRQLPWPGLLALLPSIVLLLLPGDIAVDLPWMHLGGSGLAIDSVSRWWLAMSVVVWAAAAMMLSSGVDSEINPGNQMTWFLLCLAGQLGTVVAADLVSFFASSALMGYAFFGFLTIENNHEVKRAGLVYLVLLILADVVLFEALLMVAVVATDLKFVNLAATIAQSPDAIYSLWFTLIAFILRIGIWPLHVWLLVASNSARSAVLLVMWIAPIATGLLGMLRWLPLGEIASTSVGALLQVAGIVTMLYAAIFGLRRARRGQGIVHLIIAATGTVTLVIGVGLGEPLIWTSYAGLVPLFVFSVGLGLTIISSGKVCYWRGRPHPAAAAMPVSPGLDYFEQLTKSWSQRVKRLGLDTFPALRTAMHDSWLKRWHKQSWQRRLDCGEHYIRRWSFAILIVLLLSILVTVAGLITGN